MRYLAAAAAAGLLLLPSAAAAKSKRQPCPRLKFEGKALKLDAVERRLVCGDPGSEGWRNVSLPQAREFLTAFLQTRGYHFPEFRAEGETLVVRIGKRTKVKRFSVAGAEGIYDGRNRRRIVGELLTPALLDTVQKAMVFELQTRGYACAEAVVTADAAEAEVHADLIPRGLHRIVHMSTPTAPHIDERIFPRYRAFRIGQVFDQRLLGLTADRIKQDDLFASAYYDVQCDSDTMRIKGRVVDAPARLWTVGVGADTEGELQGRVRLKVARLDERASSGQLTAFASGREQSLDALGRWYLRADSRLHLVPAGFVRRENEVQYEAGHGQASFGPAWTFDGEDLRLEVQAGPAYHYFNTIKGIGPDNEGWLQLATRTELRTHLFEYYQRDPRRGWTALLETASRPEAHWMRLSGEYLWNVGGFDPPLAVFATRGYAGTAWVDDPASAYTTLPPTDRFFLGGDADFRGGARKRLPDDGRGFLTAVYDGVELRMGDVLPLGIQPFVFFDAAMGGVRHFELDPDVYYAPGAGIRWASPVGTIRTTLARGRTWRRGSPTPGLGPRWQFFFSFGKEF